MIKAGRGMRGKGRQRREGGKGIGIDENGIRINEGERAGFEAKN